MPLAGEPGEEGERVDDSRSFESRGVDGVLEMWDVEGGNEREGARGFGENVADARGCAARFNLDILYSCREDAHRCAI